MNVAATYITELTTILLSYNTIPSSKLLIPVPTRFLYFYECSCQLYYSAGNGVDYVQPMKRYVFAGIKTYAFLRSIRTQT